jgi:hypothetical protein
MDKIKEKLHIGSSKKAQTENDSHGTSHIGTIEGMYTLIPSDSFTINRSASQVYEL